MANFRNLLGMGNPSRHRHEIRVPTSCVSFYFPVPMCVCSDLVACEPLSSKLSFYHRDKREWEVRARFVLRSVGVFFAWHWLRVGPTTTCWHIVHALCRHCWNLFWPVLSLCWPRICRGLVPCWPHVGRHRFVWARNPGGLNSLCRTPLQKRNHQILEDK